MARAISRTALQRALALSLMLVAVPAVLGVSGLLQDTPIREGEPSPRTVIAPDLIRVVDGDATERERRTAADEVEPVLVEDDEAQAAIVQRVRDVFASVREVRGPSDDDVPSRLEQIETLQNRISVIDEDGARLLAGLSDEELSRVTAEADSIAQQFARQRIGPEEVEDVADRQLRTELIVRPLAPDVAEAVVEPVVRAALRPTVRVDEEATADEREAASGEVADVIRSFTGGSVIVAAGEPVDPVQLEALRQRGLEGAEPWRALIATLGLAATLTLVVGAYLRAYRPQVWRSGRRLVLLASLMTLFAVALEAVTVFAPSTMPAWLYLIPVGAVAMLATILIDPPVGVLMAIPVTVLVAFTVPGEPGVVAFAAIASLGSVPLVSRLSAQGDLRRAAARSTVGYAVLAGVLSAIFASPEQIPTALLAGLLNGVLTALIVNGALPFLESVFGILTTTSLLDLSDRNHPLLRELEQKALGSYNHSIMVATLVERACRSIGADSLLGSVAALYHDIGKVAKPYFYVENQSGIPNPHDDLEPAVSAVIIQEHVSNGIKMAKTYRLPSEVAEGIATHHGTTLVSYFYMRALNAAADGESVDERHYRYKGRKPSSKEMAVLMLADCCEGASRAAAQANRNLSKTDLENIVRKLVAERIDDGQLDEADLTFRDLKLVQESIIDTLVGVYHPRITYPDPKVPAVEGKQSATSQPREGTARVEG